MHRYSQDNILYYIALSISKHIGVYTGRYIIDNITDISLLFNGSEIRKILPHLNKRAIDSLQNKSTLERAKRIIEWCNTNDISIIPIASDNYPPLLLECPDAPLLLYIKGNINAICCDYGISIVGTRNITNYGRTMTKAIISDIAKVIPSMSIVSGLAFGVDIEAHRSALSLGLPTVAVLAHGLDRVYPYQHTEDARCIVEQGGALVSEYPPTTKPERYNFVGRNRIIAALTKATLVIEAGLKSGSLITAEIAASYNREVLAVPGRVSDRYSEGCNDIIRRMKAALVTNAKDVLSYMGIDTNNRIEIQSINFQEEVLPDNPIIKIISENQPIHINELIRISGLDINTLSSNLFDLEVDGIIEAMPGGLYIISQ